MKYSFSIFLVLVFNLTILAQNWTGVINQNWNNPNNWDTYTIPDSNNDVVIPSGTPNLPMISDGIIANCANLTIEAGATLTQNGTLFNTSNFNVYGNFYSEGTFTQTSAFAYFNFKGISAANWNDENSDDTFMNVELAKSLLANTVTVNDDITANRVVIDNGILQIAANKTLIITGDQALSLEIQSGGTLRLNSSQTIDVTGGVYFDDGSQADIIGGDIFCTKDFVVKPNASYDIHLTGGTVNMTGSADQHIHDEDGGNLMLHHLNIDKPSGTCYLKYADLDLSGNLIISSGVFSCNNGPSATSIFNINIEGWWSNYFGPSAFEESTGTVTFDGTAVNQYCFTENFYILEANMNGGFFFPDGVVTCQYYNWTDGTIIVQDGATLGFPHLHHG
ncbi:MAG: hypothetical protein DRJ05_12490 [Bacteroidetes bacterium]|nr:MAG: hypothetical protein DRJ05_12490 [Bacteroidota bacterium]